MSDARRLRLGTGLTQAIRAHGRETYPHECCGFLIGTPGPDGDLGGVSELVRASNARADSPQNRYLIPPEEFVRVQREADKRGLDILGFYHSHPDHLARPSEFDRAHAWPAYAYLIVAVAGGEPGELRGWTLAGEAMTELHLEED